MIHALVPVKSLATAKSRLAPLLTLSERQRLVLAMLGDVLAVLTTTQAIAATTVIASDQQVARIARAAGANVRADTGSGLNGELSRATVDVGTGVSQVLVLFADLPLLTPAELRSLLEAGAHHQVVLGASRDGGTNALVTGIPTVPFRFGTGSLARHQAEAAVRGSPAQVVHSPGLATDIDRPDDLLALAEQGGATASQRLARKFVCAKQLWLAEPCV